MLIHDMVCLKTALLFTLSNSYIPSSPRSSPHLCPTGVPCVPRPLYRWLGRLTLCAVSLYSAHPEHQLVGAGTLGAGRPSTSSVLGVNIAVFKEAEGLLPVGSKVGGSQAGLVQSWWAAAWARERNQATHLASVLSCWPEPLPPSGPHGLLGSSMPAPCSPSDVLIISAAQLGKKVAVADYVEPSPRGRQSRQKL